MAMQNDQVSRELAEVLVQAAHKFLAEHGINPEAAVTIKSLSSDHNPDLSRAGVQVLVRWGDCYGVTGPGLAPNRQDRSGH